ncbi:hypothetical protein BDZ97DRAFT_1765262 [Flammula alnicola]|nr:hypothetical protein BDZ97DRAFT_1765262 [Flammula alnicola]
MAKGKNTKKNLDASKNASSWSAPGKPEAWAPATDGCRTGHLGVGGRFHAIQESWMDVVSDVAQRNLLMWHICQLVDTLELKGNQTTSLYDILQFKDWPTCEFLIPDKSHCPPAAQTAAGSMLTSNPG